MDLYRPEESQPQQIAVVRALPGLGDMLCAVPAFRALRAAFPEAQVILIGLPWAQTFVSRFSHYIDEFLEFPGYPGLPERPPQVQELPAFFNRVQQRHFDLALQMHGNGMNINAFTVLLGAHQTAGFFLPGQYCPDERYFLPYPANEMEVRRNLQLLAFLGIPLQGETLEFPLTESDWQAWQALAKTRELQRGEYICIHPGAQSHDRRWPPDRFAAVADALAARGWQIVLTGTAGEAEQTAAVRQAMRAQTLDLTGQTTLGTLAILLQSARLVISNCTGVSHVAAALQVPSVVIFSNSAPHRWAPLDRERHRPVYTLTDRRPGGDCGAGLTARCLREDCLTSGWRHHFPLGLVAPEAVMAEVDTLLERTRDNGRPGT